MNTRGTLLFAGTFVAPNSAPTQPVGISPFSIDPGTGALTTLNESFIDVAPSNVSLAFAPWFVLDSSGEFLYTTAFGLSDTLGFTVSDNGAVTTAPSSPFMQTGGGNLTLVNFQP